VSFFPIKSPRRIANKIILLVLALELFSLVLWGALTYSSSRDELLKSKSSQLNEIAFSTTNQVAQFFLPISIEANIISSSISSFVGTALVPQTYNLLYSFLSHRSEIEEVSIIDNDATEIKRISRMTGVGENERRNFKDDPLIENALLGERGIGSIYFSEYFEPMVWFATPIESNSGQEKVILSVINLKWLWDTVQKLKVGKSGYVYVVNESLKLVAHPDPSLVLSDIQLQSTTVSQSLFSEEGQTELSFYDNFIGDTVVGVSRYDSLHRWWVVVEQPVDEALAPLNRVINRFVLAFILTVILTIISVVFFSKRMMRPLEHLESAIDKLIQGKNKVQIDVPGNTELASLSMAFNEMAINLYEKNEKLQYQAYHDELTKLPNRKKLFEYFETELKQHISEVKPFSLLLLDLDRFKEINDSLGHKCGDLLLIELSARLLEVLSSNDLVVRLGGDEFAIVLKDADSLERAEKIAISVKRIVQAHFELEGMRLLVDVSIGIALFPLHGEDGSLLMRRADIAMYHAKKSGKGIAIYDESYDLNSPERLALIGSLPKAIEGNELVLHYQPKIDVASRKVTGVEALVRWNHPELGLLMPDHFISLVELGDTIIELTNWVLNRALSDCRKWRDLGFEVDVAINVSTINIQDEEFVNNLNEMILKHRIDPALIQLEITESVIMADTKKALKTMNALDSMGIRISIDDFGTGYSSLAYLKQIPVDELKIDKSFVMHMEDDESDAVIVRSTIDLAHNLGLKVTAEGVETEAALELLDILGCNSAQGYHICRPVPEKKLIPWLQDWQDKNNSHKNIHEQSVGEKSKKKIKVSKVK